MAVLPGTPRQLRVFISHRHGLHKAIYADAISRLQDYFGDIQDLSIPEDDLITSPHGADLPGFRIRSEIAARIYESDIFIAPSSVAMGRGEWTSFEIECAAFAYSQPILFVHMPGQQRNAALVTYITKHVDKCGVTELGSDGGNIEQAVIGLIATKQIKSQPTPDRSSRNWYTSRTPDQCVLERVRIQFPYMHDDGNELVRGERIRRRRSR